MQSQTKETTAAKEPEKAMEVRSASTVMASTQMIDLRDLPLPDRAALMGSPEVGFLSYQAPIEVAAAVDLYRSILAEQGWQENAKLGHTSDVTVVFTFFTKTDFVLGLSAGKIDEDHTIVSLINLSNIDLRILPKVAEAEAVYFRLLRICIRNGYYTNLNLPNIGLRMNIHSQRANISI